MFALREDRCGWDNYYEFVLAGTVLWKHGLALICEASYLGRQRLDFLYFK
jgi:hypothetical protein